MGRKGAGDPRGKRGRRKGLTRPETPLDRAGRLVAQWRTVWGSWVDHWETYCPGKTQRQVHADVPGIMTRLSLTAGIAKEIEAAVLEDRKLRKVGGGRTGSTRS